MSKELTPVQVTGVSNVVAIAAGSYYSLALESDGSVWAWGTNTSGQLGDGTTTARAVPVKVASISDVVAISAGLDHSLAIEANGTAWAWGSNDYGQLGNGSGGSGTGSAIPVQVTGLP